MRPVRIIRDEHDCRAWALEQGLTMKEEPMVTCGGGPPGDPNGELSALPVGSLVAMVAQLRGENAALIDAMRDEMDEGLRLRELGGAMPDENITAMTERVIAERDELRTRRMVDDFVKRDAYRYRKLLMQDKHWLGVFRCDPDGTPSDSISADELSALLDAMDGPEMLPVPEAP